MLGYLGPEGTFSHTAALMWSGKESELTKFKSIPTLIKAVDIGQIQTAIVPIENSIDGGINVTLDTLAFDVNVHIVGEYVLKISQNLMVKKGYTISDIMQIASISPAIGQCQNLLNSEIFDNVDIVYTNSTTEAAKLSASSDGSIACIAASSAASIYNLEILYHNCCDENNNSTRFIIIEKQQAKKITTHDKTSIAFTLENKPGSLYAVLKIFASDNINMTKIESRPMKTKLGLYVFFIDIDGNINDASTYSTLEKVKKHTDFFKFLGSYSY